MPGWSENSLVFLCELRCAPGWSEGEEPLRVCLPAQYNVHQLRLCLCMHTTELSSPPHPLAMLDPARVLLLYRRHGDWYEIYDDCQVLYFMFLYIWLFLLYFRGVHPWSSGPLSCTFEIVLCFSASNEWSFSQTIEQKNVSCSATMTS